MTTTNASFLAAVQGLDITGVNKLYNHPPASIDTSQLPIAFIGMPGSDRPELITGCVANNKTRTITIYEVVASGGQSTQTDKFALLAAAMDNIETALDALAVSAPFNFLEYTLETSGNFEIGENAYWTITATITSNDMRI